MTDVVNWDEVAGNADKQPIQTVRSFAAAAEEMHVSAGNLSAFAAVVMDIHGEYRISRAGNRFAALGMVRVLEDTIAREMAQEADEQG